MLLITQVLIWYLTIGLSLSLLFRNQINIAKDIIKEKMESERRIKKSHEYWLRTSVIICSVLWPLIVYKSIKRMRGEE